MPLRKIHHPVGAYTAEENGAALLPAAGGSLRAVFVISLICAAQFVLQLDLSIVNVALPSIQRELGMPAAESGRPFSSSHHNGNQPSVIPRCPGHPGHQPRTTTTSGNQP